jgi:hypothetical protein
MPDGLLQAQIVHRATATSYVLARLLLGLFLLLLLLLLRCDLDLILVRVLPVRVLIVFGVPRVVDIFFILLDVVGVAPRDWLVPLPRELLVGRIFERGSRRRSAQPAFMACRGRRGRQCKKEKRDKYQRREDRTCGESGGATGGRTRRGCPSAGSRPSAARAAPDRR